MKKLLLAALCTLLAVPVIADDNPEESITYKAEFLADLVHKVTWADQTDQSDTDRVIIYVLGESAVGNKLQEFAAAHSGKWSNVDVKIVTVNDDISDADILFLASGDMSILAKALKKVNGTHVLTVSDAKDFARYGVMINFAQEEGSSDVKLEVNRLVLDNVGATLDEDLIKDATLI